MAETRDVEIEVFGDLDSIESFVKLAAAAVADQVASDWEQPWFETVEDVVAHLVDAAKAGRPATFVRGQTGMELENLRLACRAQGLPYSMWMDAVGEHDEVIVNWSPRIGNEAWIPAADRKPRPDDEVIARLRERGGDALARHLEKAGRKSLGDVERKVTADPAALEAAERWEDVQEPTPSP